MSYQVTIELEASSLFNKVTHANVNQLPSMCKLDVQVLGSSLGITEARIPSQLLCLASATWQSK